MNLKVYKNRIILEKFTDSYIFIVVVFIMYSRKQSSQIKQEFWTSFGQYMAPILSAEGEKINWINYRTGEKLVQFKMDADNNRAKIEIIISNKDDAIRDLYFEQFEQLKNIFNNVIGEDWQWKKNSTDDYGNLISSISCQMHNVNIFRKDDWPKTISFLKKNIIALDEFWSNVKIAFQVLRLNH